MNQLGNRLKKIRESLGIKQAEVAEKLHISQSSISGYESCGKVPSLQMIVALAKCYGVSVDYLLGLAENDYTEEDSDDRALTRLGRLPQKESKHPISKNRLVTLANSMAAYIAVGSPAGSAPINTAGDVIFSLIDLLDAAAAEDIEEVINKADALAAAGLSAIETIRKFMKCKGDMNT